jgi:molecular chaperone GrpE
MSEQNEERPTPSVNDRRRFDRNGNPIPREEPAPTPEPERQAEAPAEAEAEAAPRSEVSDVASEELAAARRRIDDLARAYQALERDREDFKARLTRERERMIDVERGNVAQVLLETLDELDLSLKASAEDQSPLAQGVRMIRDGIQKKLAGLGLERISVLNQPFDPNLAEAADMELTASPDDDQRVVDELRAGYRLKDRVIRPARVKVAKYVQPAEA